MSVTTGAFIFVAIILAYGVLAVLCNWAGGIERQLSDIRDDIDRLAREFEKLCRP